MTILDVWKAQKGCSKVGNLVSYGGLLVTNDGRDFFRQVLDAARTQKTLSW